MSTLHITAFCSTFKICLPAWPLELSNGIVLGINNLDQCQTEETPVTLQKKMMDAPTQQWKNLAHSADQQMEPQQIFKISCSVDFDGTLSNGNMVLSSHPQQVFFYHIKIKKD